MPRNDRRGTRDRLELLDPGGHHLRQAARAGAAVSSGLVAVLLLASPNHLQSAAISPWPRR